MIALDASVVIAALKRADVHHGAGRALLAVDDDLFLHTITLAEVLVGGERIGRVTAMATTIAGLGIREIPRHPEEATTLAQLRVATGLTIPDCCALLAAEASTGRLATFDLRLAQVARSRGIEVLGSR